MDLQEAREQIWAIDTKMAALFEQRMKAVRAVAAYKKEHGLAIEDKDQEATQRAAHSSLIDDEDLRPFYLRFLADTIEVSKLWQHHLNEGIAPEELLAQDESAVKA